MKTIFLINFLVSLFIFISLLRGFFKHYADKRTNRIVQNLFIIGLLYLIFSGISILWFLDIIVYATSDFLVIYAILIIIQTLFLFNIIFLFSQNKKLFYFLFLYLISFFSLFSPLFNFFILSLISSFLLTLILFIYLSNREDVYRKVGYIGILYSIFSLICQSFLLIGIGKIYVFSLVSNVLFLILIFILLSDLRKYPLLHLEFSQSKEKSYSLLLLRYFVFMVVLVNFIFIATIGIHEFGHYAVSKFYDCQYRRIVYEGNFPHTDILCKNISDNTIVLLGGILTPIILAIILFLVGGKFVKSTALLMIGFNLMAANGDFRELGMSDNLIMFALFGGIMFLVIGIIMLAKSRVDSTT